MNPWKCQNCGHWNSVKIHCFNCGHRSTDADHHHTGMSTAGDGEEIEDTSELPQPTPWWFDLLVLFGVGVSLCTIAWIVWLIGIIAGGW